MSAVRPVVFFLSDYGLADEFVGVVHAVLFRLAPDLSVVDLTHGVPAFDVRAGAEALARAVPHLGPGVVLAVVDPGVGSDRRSVAVRAFDGRWFVAPDNGLVVTAAEASGGVEAVVVLRKPFDAPATFDGRDVFAPAAAALATGASPGWMGDEVDAASLVRLPVIEVTRSDAGGRAVLRVPAAWVDRFGNVQLAAPEGEGPSAGAGQVMVRSVEAPGRELAARRVRAFAELEPGEVGVLADANGRLAVVVREGSAAAVTGLVAGRMVELVW
ncbi:MAG TPA: SAM-dependent chlorinase/fluorinase [Acidimicrobiales bacterium]|nr:SAM-dependent chlorinase/fluorinase [Acidimicrobiales bacterium]